MKPITALIILDGFGYREEKEYNAILTDGGPGFSTETITYMVYKVAFGEMRQGYGTAMAVILFLIILVLGGFQSTALRKREVQL